MTMSVYRVNSAYLKTTSVSNRKADKTNYVQNVSFGKSTPTGWLYNLKRILTFAPKHANDNFSLPKQKPQVELLRHFHGHKSLDAEVSN